MRTNKFSYPVPVVGDWVKLHTTEQKGCVHRILPDGKFIVLVPAEDWPFPTWVSTWPENLRRIHRPKKVDDMELKYDPEPAPF